MACGDCTCSHQACSAAARPPGDSRSRLVSVLVSFTAVRRRSPVFAWSRSRWSRTLADAG